MVGNTFTLLVLRAKNPEHLAKEWAAFGMDFSRESHGDGPTHFVCNVGDLIFEIYPLADGQSPTTSVRVGLRVDDLASLLMELPQGMTLVKTPQDIEGGATAIVRDSEGHTIELTQDKQRFTG